MSLGEDDLLSVPFKWVVYLVAGLPSSALVLCILLSLLLHGTQSTATHCGVANWLPSVSAAVASHAPELYIWRIFIAIHGGPRFALAFAYRNLVLLSPLRPLSLTSAYRTLCHAACALHLLENLFLLALTSISSVENHGMHKLCFTGFVFTALSYMILATVLFSVSGRRRTTSVGETSFEYKVFACLMAIASVITAGYFYWRHNTYCEPGVYTLFAIAEYVFVASNIAFHSTLYLDFSGKRLSLSSSFSPHYDALLPTMMQKDI